MLFKYGTFGFKFVHNTVTYSECPKTERLVWQTEQKMVQFSARSDFRRSGLKILLKCSFK